MIRIAHILPSSYLEYPDLLSKEDIHLILAHKILDDEKYRNFYNNLKNKYLILDNSAFEYGGSLPEAVLIKAIMMIRPDEFVLPDVLRDGAETRRRSETFLKRSRRISGLKFMGIAQGNNLEEWTECYRYFADDEKIHSLGIPLIYSGLKPFGKKIPQKFVSGREFLLHHLEYKGLLNKKKPHHLLGLRSRLAYAELTTLKRYFWIRSADTALAYLHTKLLFTKKRNYKINFSDRCHKNYLPVIKATMALLDKAAGYTA